MEVIEKKEKIHSPYAQLGSRPGGLETCPSSRRTKFCLQYFELIESRKFVCEDRSFVKNILCSYTHFAILHLLPVLPGNFVQGFFPPECFYKFLKGIMHQLIKWATLKRSLLSCICKTCCDEKNLVPAFFKFCRTRQRKWEKFLPVVVM